MQAKCLSRNSLTASWNILSDSAYSKYAFAKSSTEEQQQRVMPLTTKHDLCKKYLKQLRNDDTNIICLQELDVSQGGEGSEILEYLESLGYKVCDARSLAKKNNTRYSLKQTTCIAYNPKKFSLVGCKSKELDGQKWSIGATLSLIGVDNSPGITVVIAHLPFK